MADALADLPSRSDRGQSTLKKITWRLLPLFALGYGIAIMDRTNIGLAALQMNRDLHFSAWQAKPGLTPISCHAVLERSACAPFIKERRMECINATSLRRKSRQWGTQRGLGKACSTELGSLAGHS
jgi:hypothetical protein